MIVNVAEVVIDADLGGTTFTRKRPTTSLANYGLSSSTYTATTMPGIIQPAATSDAKLLPEGVRLSDVQAFFTSYDISPGNGTSVIPDILIDDAGAEYRVLHVQAFGKNGMVKALAQRVFPGATT